MKLETIYIPESEGKYTIQKNIRGERDREKTERLLYR